MGWTASRPASMCQDGRCHNPVLLTGHGRTSLPIINFLNVVNIERRLRNPKEHAGCITAPRWRLPVTESFALPPDPRWNAMTDYPAAIPLLAIQRLRCPKCRTRMRLARISPGPTGFDLRTFECTKCDHVEQIAIASDPMKSGAVGWFTGELQPPK
jgi:hypothetical protein